MLPTGKLSPLPLQQGLQEVLDCQRRLRRFFFSEEIILIMAESLARRAGAESEDVSRDAVIGRRGRSHVNRRWPLLHVHPDVLCGGRVCVNPDVPDRRRQQLPAGLDCY